MKPDAQRQRHARDKHREHVASLVVASERQIRRRRLVRYRRGRNRIAHVDEAWTDQPDHEQGHDEYQPDHQARVAPAVGSDRLSGGAARPGGGEWSRAR